MSAEQRRPHDHPLRAIRVLVDDVLRDMSREFDGLYARVGKVKLRGLAKVNWLFVFASAAFNLIRLPKLLPRPA